MSVPRWKHETARLIIVLAVTGLVAGFVLALVYGWIGPIIEEQQLERVRAVGLLGIFPDATDFEELDLDELPQGVEPPVYRVKDEAGNELGIWFIGASSGYGGPVKIAVGIDQEDASIVGVRVINHAETPGLGDVIEKDEFLEQFESKALSDPFKPGDDVAAYTGATVSVQAVYQGASSMGREILDLLGVDVEVEEVVKIEDELDLCLADLAAPVGPEYADSIQKMIGEDIQYVPADLWEITDAEGVFKGVATKVSVRGYAGSIDVAVVIEPEEQVVLGVEVLRQSETPGIGTRITQARFLDQFNHKSTTDEFKVGNDIDGLTGATVSSQAVVDAVVKAIELINALY